ncbi:hypothetical protein [Actinoplanes friuliensis]|jgi:hypothetical protein|uniref:Uncharacterized protein n=1 Tax=Actinoplanes friuliensis DSM 7358 TaxID=1246995 RepID=U5WCE0_9ACTN|nr:hypothetical protein [Actinoplanes friuliensis]AGZ45581.1 hypothetical protein AFR_36625 [Actinoplanes friuliensis DSM 7358]
MSRYRLVTSELFRTYRPVALWFWSIMIVGVAIGSTVVNLVTEPKFSLWLVVVGASAKWWLGVVGVLLVSLHLRQFVANGITRRDFMTGMAVFGLAGSLLTALIVPIGHALEQLLLGIAGPLPPDYPALSAGAAALEFGHVLPASLAFFVAGATATAGFYRYGAWGGLALVVPAVLPIGFAEVLLGVDQHGGFDSRFVPYAAAAALSLVVTGLVALLHEREMRHVAIRRGPA